MARKISPRPAELQEKVASEELTKFITFNEKIGLQSEKDVCHNLCYLFSLRPHFCTLDRYVSGIQDRLQRNPLKISEKHV